MAAAVLAAGLTAACGTSSPPVGAAAASVAGPSSEASSSDAASATASASASAAGQASPSTSPPAPPSTSASTPTGSSPTPSRTRTATPTRTPSQPPRTSAAPAPARIPGPGYDSSVGQAQVDAALRAAKADGRMVLLDFGANWCGNCKAADKVFAQPQTAALLGESYHLVKVDIGGSSSAASALLRKYSPGGGSYKMPVLVVLSPSGTVRTDTHATGNPSLTAVAHNSFLFQWAA
ncbi:thioredoxin family protein [Streptomyces sp. NPDC054901]